MSVKFMTAAAGKTEVVEPAALAAMTIPDGMTILVDSAEYICTNNTDGCCSEQSADVTASTATCWGIKPAPKQNDQITTEALAAFSSGTSTSCIKWTSGYAWR